MSKEPRFAQLTMEELNDEQKPLGEQIIKVSLVGLGGPYNPMLRSPVFGQKMFDLLYYLRWQTSVPLKLNEFAILIIGRRWRSQVEWFAHAPLAIKAGLSPEIVAELKTNRRPVSKPRRPDRGEMRRSKERGVPSTVRTISSWASVTLRKRAVWTDQAGANWSAVCPTTSESE